ncbi:MAG: ARPP-1 family domain-containing protein [Verrucomicrobiales bacterium]
MSPKFTVKLWRVLTASLKAGWEPVVSRGKAAVEDPDLQERKETFRSALTQIPADKSDAVGYAFVINGEINTADIYGSGALFRKLWSKLLDAVVLEAIAELRTQPKNSTSAPSVEAIQRWFFESEKADVSERQEVPPRLRVDTRHGKKAVVFDACDHAFNDSVLHKNVVAN